MADRVDSMSDAELRTKLAEHGFPVMPITASTRKLLVKKLKLVLDKKTKPRTSVDSKAENRRILARYSSGEESDLDSKNNAREKRGRRATTGGAMLPPAGGKARRATPKKDSPVKRDSDRGSESDEEKSPVRTHEEVETVTTRRVTRTYAGAGKDGDEYETGSDSDVDAERRPALSAPRSHSRSSDYISSTLANDVGTSPPKPTSFSRPSISPTNYSSSLSSDHLNSIRSRLGLTSTIGDRPGFTSTLADRSGITSTLGDRSSRNDYVASYSTNTYRPSTSTIDEVESPYLSNFTKRLSALKAEPSRPSYPEREINNGGALPPRRSYISSASRDVVDYKSAEDKKFLKNNIVSLALVALVALFFFCLFFMYIVKRNDITSVVDDQSSVIPICQLHIPGNRPGVNCVPREQVGYAKDLMKVIHPELTRRVAAFRCGEPGALPYLTEREIVELAGARAEATDAGQCRTDLNNLEVLLVNNPRWGLSVVQLKNLYTRDSEFAPITSTDAVVQQRSKGSVALTLAEPSTPLSCLLLQSLYSTGSTLAAVALLTAAALGGRRAYGAYVAYRKRRRDEVYSMVEQIVDVISQETEDGGEPYVSVDHVRDTLILPQNRERMSSVWDAAVQFIQRNESRVRMEVQSVDGEDCRVWRWVSPHGSPRRSAAWQGQAFETQEGSVNNLAVSPTPCLKIRHMFDKNDATPNLRTVVTDAILEKCGERCNVLHVDVDAASCCVYARCASPADAGVVYRSLHGWWYDGRLITVKYLRLERYLQRFPTAPSAGPYLKMSRPRRTWDE